LPPPPPTTTIEDNSLDVVSDVRFSALNMVDFDDAAFAEAFRTEFILTVARVAGVGPHRVQVTSIAAGSVVVSSIVRFPPTGGVDRNVLAQALSSNPQAVFASSSTLSSEYGFVSATVTAAPPPPMNPSPPPVVVGASPSATPADAAAPASSSSLPMIAGGAGGGALLLAAVAFFLYRRRSKRQSDGELPQFSNSKPQQAAAPVFTPAPLFLTPSVRSRPHTQSAQRGPRELSRVA
jgi:hypothetical protein